LLIAVVSAGLAWLWSALGAGRAPAVLLFLIQIAFFIADRDLLAGLPRRRLSFAPWREQILALALPRAAAALALGLLVPWLGWRAPFYVNLAVQFIGTLALYRGAILEPGRLGLTRITIPTDRLPAGGPDIRLLHVSDLHIERLGAREERLLELAAEAAPDLILITGDYANTSFNTDPETHRQIQTYLGKLCAPYGVFAVTGSPPVDLAPFIPPLFADAPARLVVDEALCVAGPGGQPRTLAGVACHHDIPRDAASLDRVLAGAPGDGPRILLYHSPELMPQTVERGIDLYLCGHTHGGQVRLPFIGAIITISKLGRRYVMGHYHEGRTHLYISRGVGFEGLGAPRVRLFCPPEITLITLASANG
jgi:predicted MPP superfamily phosphohydrolase